MKIIHDIFSPLKLGVRQSCKGCNGLVLRKSKRGPIKFCTDKCRDRYDRKLRYWRYKELEQTRVKLWKLAHPDKVKATNAYHRNKRKERINFKFNYLQSILPLEERIYAN